MEPTKLKNFMSSPLLKWLGTLPDSPTDLSFNDLTTGPFLHNVLHSFDANISNATSLERKFGKGATNHHKAKVNNISLLVKKLKSYYEDVLGQCLVISLPDALKICQEPPTSQSLQEMDKVLLLILGAAVQCSQKEHIIASIKNLPYDLQHAFVEKIKEVTDNPKKIWPSELDDPTTLKPEDKDNLYLTLVSHVRRVCKERDEFADKVVEISLASPNSENKENGESQDLSELSPEKNHMALEVAESKAKIRKLNQQLEGKIESLLETKEEMEKYRTQNSKLKQENLELTQEARAAKAFRDELDILRERANKVDKLEAEMQRYKDKVGDIEFYKSRMDELREDNKILVETKEMLEDQLETSRKRNERIITLENDILKHKSEMNNLQVERDLDKTKIEELIAENLTLQMSNKNSFSESQSLQAEMQILKDGQRGRDMNILTEQFDQKATRVHKLEMLNQKLMSELEDIKLNGIEETREKILQLETENKKQNLTIKQLEELHFKDSEYTVEMEKDLAQLKTQNEQKEEIISALKHSEQEFRIERETEIENLNKLVDSLRKRQEKSQNEQLAHLEDENKKLVKEKTHLQTKVNKFEHENKKQANRIESLKKSLEAMDDMKLEKETLNSKLEHLTKELDDYRSRRDLDERKIEKFDEVNEENDKLHRQIQKLKTDNHQLNINVGSLDREKDKLAQAVQTMKVESQRCSQLESERDDLRDTISNMRIKMDNLAQIKTKTDELEQKLFASNSDNSKLRRKNDTLEKRLEDTNAKATSHEQENEKLKKNVETLKISVRKVDELEKENVNLEASKDMLDRDNRNLKKDLERLRQTLDIKEATLEELNSKAASLGRERTKLKNDLESLNEEKLKLAEIEQENQKLSQGWTVDKRALTKLREELVQEKLKCDNIHTKFEELNEKLKRLGIDQAALDGHEEFVFNERIESMEGSLNQLLENRAKKITTLESSLKRVQVEKTELLRKIELLQFKVETGDSKSALESQLSKVVKEKDQIQAELLQHQIETTSSKEKIKLIEDKLQKMHNEVVQTQVENTTLQSQSSSLLSQINQLQESQRSLETFKRQAEESEKKWQNERSDLLRDQAGLQKLHDNLQQDYEGLLKERDVQKEVERKLKSDLRKLQSMSFTLNQEQVELSEAREAVKADRERLHVDSRTLTNLRSEHARLKDDFRSLFTTNEKVKNEYCNLQSDYKSLKTTYNQMKLQHTELKGQLHDAKEQVTLLNVDNSKASNMCEVLTQMNNTLQEDKNSLINQVSLLLGQYHDLLTQTLDDKEHFHEEEKNYTDKVNHLHRQKEKLEEKIIEQYKKMDNSTPKKIGIGDRFLHKMKKATNLIGGAGNRSSRIRSTSRGRSNLHLPLNPGEDGQDSSSMGSGCNDSLDSSGQQSPHDMARSESAVELRGSRKLSNGSSSNGNGQPVQIQNLKPPYLRRSVPSHLEDSDGNNADNDSVNSLVSANSFLHGNDVHRFLETDSVLTQETVGNQSYSSHSDIGIPLTANVKNEKMRSVSRIYVNGSDQESQRSTTPKLMSWKSNNSSPIQGFEEGTPPVVPARKHSRGRADPPPLRPPKPSGSRKQSAVDNRYLDSLNDDSSTVEDDVKKENTEWYEYGCV